MAVTLVSNESVIGTLTPNVYVNRITLESTGKTNLNDKNTSVVSIHTAWTENIQAGVEGLPELIARAVSARQEDLYTNPASVAYADSKLKVKVDLVLKEAAGGLAEFWADKSESAYVNIVSIFTTDSLATKIFSIGSNMLRIFRTSGSALSGATQADINHIVLSTKSLLRPNILNESEKNKLMELGVADSSFKAPYNLKFSLPGSSEFWFENYSENIYNFLTAKSPIESFSIKSIPEVMENEMALYGSSNIPYFEIDADGNTIKNYKFSIEYIHDVNNPKHLSFCVMSYLNLDLMEEDFDIDFNMVETPHGKLIYEQIIDNFNVNTKSFLYINPVNNNIWAGPVHKATEGAQQWRTGFVEKPDSFAVIKKSVANTKIQDFRTVERLEKLNFDLSFLETQVFNRGMSTKHITSDKTDVVKQPTYFTPLHLARDQSGNCRFMFGVDYYTLLLENTLFGKLWQPFSLNNYLVLQGINTNLINFKLKRRRVNNVLGANRLGGFTVEEQPFKTGYLGESHIDTEEIIETIASGKDESGPVMGTSKFVSTFNLEEKVIALPETPGFNNITYGLRFFNGVDREMAEITDGSYQYGVELEIIDNTVNYILQQIKILYDHYTALCIYYEDAITPESYDYRSNRFRKAFDNKWSVTKPGPTATAALIKIINNFRLSQAQVGGETLGTNMVAASSALTIISDSSTGTPRGINTLRQLTLDTCSKLAKMAGTSLEQFDDNPHTDDQSSSSTPKQAVYKTSTIDKRRIKIEYWFPNSFDSDVPKSVGYDYLSPGSVSGARPLTGLWTISGAQFKNRVSAETLKYFSTTTFDNNTFGMEGKKGTLLTPGDSPDTTGYTFFSPSIINLGQMNSSAAAIPTVPILSPGNFNSVVSQAGSFLGPLGGGMDGAAALNMNKSSWSLLWQGGGISLIDHKTFSYIATKIMNYNIGGRMPRASTITTQKTKKLYSEIHSKIKFNLNEILSHQNCTAVLKGDTTPAGSAGAVIAAEQYFGVDSGVNSTDTYQSNLTPDDRELNPLEASYAGGAQNYLFLALAYYFSQDCGKGSTANSPDTYFNTNFFTLDEQAPDTILPLLKAQTGAQIAPMLTTPGIGPISSILKTLPNAIKSLLLFNQGNSRYNWESTDKDLMANANYKGAFALNYQNIKKIEVLGGFGHNDEGTTLINAPIWKSLDKDIFDQNVGKSLFCRLVTYKNAAFGVKLPNCFKLPVFHEYFILNPGTIGVSDIPVGAIPTIPVPSSVIPNIYGGTAGIPGGIPGGVMSADYSGAGSPLPLGAVKPPVMGGPSMGIPAGAIPTMPMGLQPILNIAGGTGDINDYMSTGVGIPYTR